MDKKGFALIETVVVVVVLTSALLLLYSTFNKILQTEKVRVNYDDVNYIYRTWYIKNALDSLNFVIPKNDLNYKEGGQKVYFITLGKDYSGLFDGVEYQNKKPFFEKLIDTYKVKQILLIKSNYLNDINSCTKECVENASCAADKRENCNQVYTNLSEGMITYLKSANILSSVYVLAIEYEECDNNNICHNYYGWVGV